MNILFTHPPEGNAFEIYKAFKTISNIKLLSEEVGKTFSLIDKIKFKLRIPTDLYNYNKLLTEHDFSNIDVLLIIKGVVIWPSTLNKIKTKFINLKLVSWSLDDMCALHNSSIYYTKGLKYYDLVITNKTYNVEELKTIGAKDVLFLNNAFSKEKHYPIVKKDSEYSHNVIFIGTLEKERFNSMNFLAKNNIIVDVYTDSYDKKEFLDYHENLKIHNGGLYGDKHCEAITNSKITLCFLRKINRDLQTTRSVEIPACGGCMVAERTEEHLYLFEEDKEAVFFDSDQELLEKVKLLLVDDKKRTNIVKNALIRCENSNYSYESLAKELIISFKNIV